MSVTIIIPIHNSEKYLRECVESAVSQSFRDLEILCIDGGSTDGSGDIIKDLQKEDNRIVAVYDENTSYGHKMNIGIQRARGTHIAILESDDRMEPDMIETLYKAAETYDADVTDADYCQMVTYKGRELKSMVHKYNDPGRYDRLVDGENREQQNMATSGIWTGLYKKSFLKRHRIRFNESSGASFQDLSFLFLTGLLAEKSYYVKRPLYQYRVDNTKSSVKDEKKIFEIAGECEFLKKELERRGVTEKKYWDMYYMRKYTAFYWNYCRLSQSAGNLFLEAYEKELRRDKDIVSQLEFDPFLYERTFLLLDHKELFMRKAQLRRRRPFLERACKCLDQIRGRKAVVFGAGFLGTRLLDILTQNENQADGICDSSRERQGSTEGGLQVLSVKQAAGRFPEDVYVIASSRHGREMSVQLREEGIPEDNIIIFE